MRPASAPRERRDEVRLLALDSSHGTPTVHAMSELPSLLSAGDVVIVNDAATLPGSLFVETASRSRFEIRVAALRGTHATVFALDDGSWRTDTDARDGPPALAPGELLFDRGFDADAAVARVVATGGRLLELELVGSEPLAWIHASGRPVQYSYLEDDLEVWSVQTSYASRPVAAEMPSAGRPLSWSILLELRRRGVELARLTHAAGLSASGESALDARLPLPEWYDIPQPTIDAIERASRRGGRVVAVGTTVVRALESAAREPGGLGAGEGTATLRISPDTELLVVDSILTGMHDSRTSHYQLLGAFASRQRIDRGWQAALDADFRAHELGDVALIAPRLSVTQSCAPHRAGCQSGAAPRRPKSSSTAIAAAMAT